MDISSGACVSGFSGELEEFILFMSEFNRLS